MDHVFNVNIAKHYTVKIAIFVFLIPRYYKQNEYFSLDDLQFIFPYFKRTTLRKLIDELIRHKLIIKIKPNPSEFTRKLFFIYTDKLFNLHQGR